MLSKNQQPRIMAYHQQNYPKYYFLKFFDANKNENTGTLNLFSNIFSLFSRKKKISMKKKVKIKGNEGLYRAPSCACGQRQNRM